jgi:hypothetical protein
VRPPETPAKGRCRSAAILAQGIVHSDRPLRAGRLRCERRTCPHPSHNGEELERRKADKQHDQRAFNRKAALPSLLQAMKVVTRRGPGNGVGRHDIAPKTCRMGSLCQLAEAYVAAHRILAVLRGGRKGIVCVAGPWPSPSRGEDRAIHVTRRLCWRGTARCCRARARGPADGETSRAELLLRIALLLYIMIQ